MTQAQRQTLTSWWDWSKEIVVFVGGVIVILTCIYAVMAWGFGGLKLQSQIDLEDFRKQLTSIQANQVNQAKDAKEASQVQAQAQAAQAVQAQAAQDRIIARLDAMPRPSDYAQQNVNIDRIDTAQRDLAAKVAADELKATEVATKVQRLWEGTTTPVRGVRN